MTDPARPAIAVGDWVRFYQNGVLVIGRVEYPSRVSVGGNEYVRTSAGEVVTASILEVRRG